MCWNVTCVNTFSLSNGSQCVNDAGSAVKYAEAQKKREYACQFDPIVLETTHVYCPSTPNLFAIVSRIHAITDDPQETQWLHQRIALAMKRGNALAIELGSKPAFC